MGFKQKLFSPLVWGNLLAMLLVIVLLVVGTWYFLSAYTRHGESIDVPNVVGHQETDARYMLENLGLKAVVVDSAYNKLQPAGCILDQVPAQGRKVKYGREIYLTINTERTPTMAIPDLAGNSSLREAEAKLVAMGFRLGPVEYVEGEDQGWVTGIKSGGRIVYAGERVPVDVPLVLLVEKGERLEDWDDLTDDLGLNDLEDIPAVDAE